MKVTILGRSIDRRTGTYKKSGKEWAGYFVTIGYERSDTAGLSAREILYTDEMMKANVGYIPSPGDECECQVGFSGFVESLRPIENKGAK